MSLIEHLDNFQNLMPNPDMSTYEEFADWLRNKSWKELTLILIIGLCLAHLTHSFMVFIIQYLVTVRKVI